MHTYLVMFIMLMDIYAYLLHLLKCIMQIRYTASAGETAVVKEWDVFKLILFCIAI